MRAGPTRDDITLRLSLSCRTGYLSTMTSPSRDAKRIFRPSSGPPHGLHYGALHFGMYEWLSFGILGLAVLGAIYYGANRNTAVEGDDDKPSGPFRTSAAHEAISRELKFDWSFSAAVEVARPPDQEPPTIEVPCGSSLLQNRVKWRAQVVDLFTLSFCWSRSGPRTCRAWNNYDVALFSCADGPTQRGLPTLGAAIYKRGGFNGTFGSDDRDVWTLEGVSKGDIALIVGQPREVYRTQSGVSVVLMRGTGLFPWR